MKDIKFYTRIDSIPSINLSSIYLDYPSEHSNEIKEFSNKLKYDSDVLVYNGDFITNFKKPILDLKLSKYSIIQVMNNKYNYCNTLTVNVLPSTLINGEKYYLFQKRSINSASGGKLSIFGGATDVDDHSIKETCYRELNEEIIGLKSIKEDFFNNINDSFKCVSLNENFMLQYNFIDVNINLEENFKGNPSEGEIIQVHEDELKSFFISNKEIFTLFVQKILTDFLNI